MFQQKGETAIHEKCALCVASALFCTGAQKNTTLSSLDAIEGTAMNKFNT